MAVVVNSSSKKRMREDIEEMMYGFGDASWPPDGDAVTLVESIVQNYIESLTERAAEIGDIRGKLDKECFSFIVRKDRRKFNRIFRLLKANEEIKTAQKIEIKEETD